MRISRFIVVFIPMVLVAAWCWQANFAPHVITARIPRWVMGETNRNVSYSIAIGKSQIKPWGTIWKATHSPGWSMHEALDPDISPDVTAILRNTTNIVVEINGEPTNIVINGYWLRTNGTTIYIP